MPPKGAKPTSDELLAQFDDLGIDSTTEKQPSKPTAASTTAQSEEDILAELDNLASQRPSSGPGTPRLSTNEPRPATKSPKPAAVATPRSSEDKPAPRMSGESVRSPAGNKPTTTQASEQEKPKAQEAPASGGGGWWGGIFATATAAMKQAEAAVKEIQQNEEAQKWAQQVRGNVGVLRDLGEWTVLVSSFDSC
jgi:hypothetical protein